MTLLDSYEAVVCDLDGVLYATNNASRTPEAVAAHLRELGLPAGPADVVTSSQAGAHYLAGALPAGSAVLAVGGEGVDRALTELGLRSVPVRQARAEGNGQWAAVLQGYGADLSAADLAEAAYAVQAGALWVATNTDRTLPTDRGIAPGNGSLVAAVQAAVDHPPVVVGKPHAPLYLLCAERVHHEPAELLAVGDRLDTDIAGAVETGMDSVLVLTGVDSAASLAVAPASMRPTYLIEDLRGLHAAYQPVAGEPDGWWSCGGHRRRIDQGVWAVAGATGTRIERLRAAVAAAHSALDTGEIDRAVARSLVSEVDIRQ